MAPQIEVPIERANSAGVSAGRVPIGADGHPGENGGLEKLHILLVDDNPGKLLAHEAVLAELGEGVVTARSGAEALQKLLRQDFAVIILDVNMPDMDGFETAALIRERPKFEQTPIIFVTAYNTTDLDKLRGYKLGAVDYLFLPIVPDVLKAKVKAFVELARQNQIIRRQAERLAANNEEQAVQLNTIQELNRTLLDANRELESFSYTISHDLRAPLRSLKGFSAYLLESCSLDDEARDCAERIARAATYLDNLTHDLLEYSRIAREQIHLQPVYLGSFFDDLVSIHFASSSSYLKFPAREELHYVVAQRSLLAHCVSNLISNAMKFVAPGVTPRIEIWTEQHGERVRIMVRDNGIGIHPSHHKRIFGLFERVGDVRSYEGTGVGLAIVARAAERMGGTCGVDSVPGTGSCFWIELAVALQESTPAPSAENSDLPPPGDLERTCS